MCRRSLPDIAHWHSLNRGEARGFIPPETSLNMRAHAASVYWGVILRSKSSPLGSRVSGRVKVSGRLMIAHS